MEDPDLSFMSMPYWHPERFNIFVSQCFPLDMKIGGDAKKAMTLVPRALLETLYIMEQNNEEPRLYRAFASYFIANLDWRTDTHAYFEKAMAIAKSATNDERKRVLSRSPYPRKSTCFGDQLDMIVSHCNSIIGLAQRSANEMMKLFDGNNDDDQSEVAYEKAMSLAHGFKSLDPDLRKPTQVNSELIQEIKDLPEKDLTVFIRHSFPFGSEEAMAKGEEWYLQTFCYKVAKDGRLKAMKMTCYSTKNQSLQKHVIGCFADSCLTPHQSLGTGPKKTPRCPSTVLLEDVGFVNHPQVHSFLKMMGCNNIKTADAQIIARARRDNLELLEHAMQRVANAKPQRDQYPFWKAERNGEICLHCKRSSPDIMRCPCNTCFFCDVECQKAAWPMHRKEHKRLMKNLPAS
jgi:hypothetical protein